MMAFTIQNEREDGTYVIDLNGMPYHVIESDPLFDDVKQQAEGMMLEPDAPVEPPSEIANVVPTITKAQALLYLLSLGKTEADALAAIATISDPTERAIAEIEWNYRQPFRYDHPLFVALGPAVGITDMDAAFRAAAVL